MTCFVWPRLADIESCHLPCFLGAQRAWGSQFSAVPTQSVSLILSIYLAPAGTSVCNSSMKFGSLLAEFSIL